jgi:glyoxylase-like metal-dependent hydrolase (beta-lactamase superfamily II)
MRMGEDGEMTENRVEVLCPGMIRRDGVIILEARSSATLISRGNRHILVDTSGPENRETLLQALDARQLAPEQIDSVVLTHLHHDHDGNLDMFPRAKVYVHELEMPGEGVERVSRDQELWQGVMMTATPGHTRGSMSVLVKTDNNVAIVGDAIPTEDNVRKWVPPGVHFDRTVALASMTRLMAMADIIVPGHGPSFHTANYKNKGR